MKPEASLCAHLAAARPGAAAFAIAPEDALAWQDGPLDAIARCKTCEHGALLQLVDWSRTGEVRVFALSGLLAVDLAVYARGRRSASCDVQRAEAELDALVSCAGPCEALVACDASAAQVVAQAPFPAALPAPRGAWSQRLPPPHDARWFAPLGLPKSATPQSGTLVQEFKSSLPARNK